MGPEGASSGVRQGVVTDMVLREGVCLVFLVVVCRGYSRYTPLPAYKYNSEYRSFWWDSDCSILSYKLKLCGRQTNKQRSTDNRELSSLDHARARKRTQSPTPGGRGSVSPRLASGAHRWSAPPRAALTLGVVRSMSVPHCALGAAGDPGVPLPWLSSSFLAARVARVCESRELPPARRRVSLRSRRAPLA